MTRALAAILLLALSGCATIRYNYQGQQCVVLSQSGDKLYLLCPAVAPEPAKDHPWSGRY